MVTTSSTSATQQVTQTATSQLLTSLGAGSGIDMIALANNLAVAQFASKTDRISALTEKLDTQISAASTLKSAISNLATSLGDRVRNGDLSPQPLIANSAVAKTALSRTTQPKGSYSLEVTALATSQTVASKAYTPADGPVGAGTLSIKFGTTSGTTFTADDEHAALEITVAEGATLSDVANQINAQNAGVTAYVSNTTEGAKLVLKGAAGAANGFIIEATPADPGDPALSELAWDPRSPTPGGGQLLTTAGDAQFKVDGLPISSASNTVTDAIPGVTLTLTGTNAGAPTQVSFSDSSPGITSAMSDLTAALNEIAASLNELTDPKTGELARDSGAQALKRTFQQLTNTVIMPSAPEGAPRTLADLGLSIQRDGTFSLDGARLAATLKAQPEATAAMFTNGLYGIYGTISGISRDMAMVSTDTKSYGATLGNSIARLTEQKADLVEDKAKLTEKQEVLRTQLIARFSSADSNVGASKSTLSFLKNQIAAWNNSGD